MPEVCENHPSAPRRLAHQNVLRLKVSVTDALSMEVFKSLEYLIDNKTYEDFGVSIASSSKAIL